LIQAVQDGTRDIGVKKLPVGIYFGESSREIQQ